MIGAFGGHTYYLKNRCNRNGTKDMSNVHILRVVPSLVIFLKVKNHTFAIIFLSVRYIFTRYCVKLNSGHILHFSSEVSKCSCDCDYKLEIYRTERKIKAIVTLYLSIFKNITSVWTVLFT